MWHLMRRFRLNRNVVAAHRRALRASSSRKKILVYDDAGCHGGSVQQTTHRLLQLVDPRQCDVLHVNAQYLTYGEDWESTAWLLVMPGGAARPYYDSLGASWEQDEVAPGQTRQLLDEGEGNRRIRHFVEKGGSFFGICAGAYYGAAQTEFDVGGAFSISDPGALNFYPSTAVGPAYGVGTFETGHSKERLAAPIIAPLLGSYRLETFYYGGCAFHEVDTSASMPVEVLARYDDYDVMGGRGAAAIVETRPGNGRVILSGPHIEYQSDAPHSLTPPIARKMRADDAQRLYLFGTVLRRLSVPVKPTYMNAGQRYLSQSAASRQQGFNPVATPGRTTIRWFDEIPSTQTRAIADQETLEPGDCRVYVAKAQTQGQGTNNRQWASPPNVNLYMTLSYFISRQQRETLQTSVTPVVGLTVVELLAEYGIDARYKWVNDVLIDDRKCCGALVQIEDMKRARGNLRGQYSVVHLGLGLNVNMTEADLRKDDLIALRETVTSMKMTTGVDYALDEVLHRLVDNLTRNLNHYYQYGFEDFQPRVNNRMERYDNALQYFDTSDLNGKQAVVRASIEEVDEKGHLVLSVENQPRSYHTGRLLKDREVTDYLEKKKKSEAGKTAGKLSENRNRLIGGKAETACPKTQPPSTSKRAVNSKRRP